MNGVILIDKKAGYTSRDIVNIVSRVVGTKKVGHTGTLDPMATGVLAICVGEGTKLVESLMCDDKVYEATIVLGIETDTLDSMGTILKKEFVKVSKEQVLSALKASECTYEQEVPKYSAVKVNGKKLYEYARNNEEIVLPKHSVTIYSLELISDIQYLDEHPTFCIRAHVSKGTYIRSLIRDIAKELKTVGMMSSLRRTRQGHFFIDECNLLEDIESFHFNLLSIEEILKDSFSVTVDSYLEKMILNGRVLENRYGKEQVVFKNKDGKVLAIYRVKNDFSRLYVWKMFH